MAKSYVKFVVPDEIKRKTLEMLELAKGSGVLRKGTNEVTKAVERSDAKLVVIAEDVDPEEIVMHLPILCAEKNIPYTFVQEKLALGKASGLTVQSAAIAVSKAGAGEEALRNILGKIRELQPSAPKKEAPKKEEKKAAPVKKEAPKKEEKPAAKEEKKPEAAKEEKAGEAKA